MHPGLHWLINEKRASRFFLIGNNYLWPQRSMMAARSLIKREGACVVGEMELPFGLSDHDDVLGRIRKAQPHVVLSWLLGHEASCSIAPTRRRGWRHRQSASALQSMRRSSTASARNAPKTFMCHRLIFRTCTLATIMRFWRNTTRTSEQRRLRQMRSGNRSMKASIA